MSLKRFGVSLEDNLLESLDQYVNENEAPPIVLGDSFSDREECSRT